MSAIAHPYPHADYVSDYGDAWSSRDHAVLGAYFAADGVYVEGAMGVTYEGIPAIERFFRYMLAFSSDSTIEFTNFIHEGDRFAAEWLWWGTADGPLDLGDRRIEPTGQRYLIPGAAICRVGPDGLVAHHKDYYDFATLIAQVTGRQLAPTPPRAPAVPPIKTRAEEAS